MVERQLPKLHTRVRFPSPAPVRFMVGRNLRSEARSRPSRKPYHGPGALRGFRQRIPVSGRPIDLSTLLGRSAIATVRRTTGFEP
jgi:hypothetical protein